MYVAANSSGGSDFVINDLNGLESSANELARYQQSLGNDSASLANAIQVVRANWENEEGADLESILRTLSETTRAIDEELVPTIGKYVSTLNEIVLSTRNNQNTTLG